VKRNIIVIGSSAGGVEASPKLLGSLSSNTPAAFFVTLHVTPNSESYMPSLITRRGHLPAEHARNGTLIREGRVYVAPPDYHLVVGERGISLSHGPKENRHRPAIDVMFRSAARAFGDRVAGVLLTGSLDDGVAGLQEIQAHSGLTVVQDPSEALFPEMPRNALQTLNVNHCLPLEQIERLLCRLPCSSNGGRKMKGRKRARDESGKGESAIAVPPKNGPPIAFVCPECNGPLWEFRNGDLQQFECLVGHRYSMDSLLQAHSEEMESALWVALRAIEERIDLQHRLAQQSRAAGRGKGRQLFEARALENRKHAKMLRMILEKIRG